MFCNLKKNSRLPLLPSTTNYQQKNLTTTTQHSNSISKLALQLALFCSFPFLRSLSSAGASLNTDIGPDSEAQIAPHSHEDLHDEKLQQQNPAVHYGEGDEKSAVTTDSAKPAAEKDAKEKNGGTTKQENGKKHENGKADKTNTPV